MARGGAGLHSGVPFQEPGPEIVEDFLRAIQDLFRPLRDAFRSTQAGLGLRRSSSVPHRAAQSVRGADRGGERFFHFAALFARAQDGQLALHGDGGNRAVKPRIAGWLHERAPVEFEQLLRRSGLELERPGSSEKIAKRSEARDPPGAARVLPFRIAQGLAGLRKAFRAHRQVVGAQDVPQRLLRRQARGATISLTGQRRGEPSRVFSQVGQLAQHELLFT